MLGAKARKSLLPDLRDHILASGQMADPLAFLDMAGAFLLTGGEFTARADESLRLLVMPQLHSIEGLGWLQRDADSIADWIARASQPLRNELANALTADPGDENEAAREIRAALAGRWKLMARAQGQAGRHKKTAGPPKLRSIDDLGPCGRTPFGLIATRPLVFDLLRII